MDTEKLKQAVQEAFYTAVIAFLLAMGGFLSGLSELPTLEFATAAGRAAVLAGLVAFGKGLVWFATGSKK